MTDIIWTNSGTEAVTQDEIDNIIKKIHALDGVPCPISHYFAPGVYVREMVIPAGTVAVGHNHKEEHICTLTKGRIMFFRQDRKVEIWDAPHTILAKPGHKIVYAVSECVVQNIHPNPDNCRDQDELERRFITKNKLAHRIAESYVGDIATDHLDFELMDYIPEPEDLQYIELPEGFDTVITVRKSPIHGKGVFITIPVNQYNYIAPYKIGGDLTTIAKYINHSAAPNGDLVGLPNGDIVLMSKRNILGCTGDSLGEEITIDYRRINQCHGDMSEPQPLSP